MTHRLSIALILWCTFFFFLSFALHKLADSWQLKSLSLHLLSAGCWLVALQAGIAPLLWMAFGKTSFAELLINYIILVLISWQYLKFNKSPPPMLRYMLVNFLLAVLLAPTWLMLWFFGICDIHSYECL